MCVQNLKFVALPVPEIIAIEVLGEGVANPQSWGRGGRRRMVPFERELVSFYRHRNFSSIFTRFRDNV